MCLESLSSEDLKVLYIYKLSLTKSLSDRYRLNKTHFIHNKNVFIFKKDNGNSSTPSRKTNNLEQKCNDTTYIQTTHVSEFDRQAEKMQQKILWKFLENTDYESSNHQWCFALKTVTPVLYCLLCHAMLLVQLDHLNWDSFLNLGILNCKASVICLVFSLSAFTSATRLMSILHLVA